MSRNSKNRRKLLVAKSFSELRKSGGKGPTRTEKKTTKRNTWCAAGRPTLSEQKQKRGDRESATA